MDRLKLDGILSGEIRDQSVPDRSILTLGLVVVKGGQRTVIPDGDVTFTANPSGQPRVDMVEWDGKSLSVVVGTPGATPAAPALTAGSIPICLVYLPDGYTEIYDINIDTQTQGVVYAFYNAVGGLYASRFTTTGSLTTSRTFTELLLPIHIQLHRGGLRYRYGCGFRVANEGATTTLRNFTFRLEPDGQDSSGLAVQGGIDGIRAVVDGGNPASAFVEMVGPFTAIRFIGGSHRYTAYITGHADLVLREATVFLQEIK